ncbi:DUF6415 family natural product biosynthesis protein [Streptomyces sp. NPDC091279]|uniref:DUF6415 family natural product biosynthesis protein n=1 Tax=unclassified Streptomyces TaxID=2593676 RepID=UPI0037FA55F9
MVRAEFDGELMTMPVRIKDPTVPADSWTPPLNPHALQHVLSMVHRWNPVDWDLVFDALDTVMGEVSHHAAGTSGRSHARTTAPGHDHAEDLAQRFRGALMQLVNRGLRDKADEKYPDLADLIARARELRSEELPTDPWQAQGLLRQLGQVTLELVEGLEEVGLVTGLIEC